ncbi:hypothetical protein [Actinomadura verrucosospora]|uniref:Uncharacterized protein n=1 Tax=Actinomadura verrucosospora TaxID=46165 RepID=A0A7D4ABY0_ACTVE|nr:hypothetical protein [Actinomadura verrucosospora]QKG27265.1 hypothetical protein ACTIVE_8918 [Actinomadura verrucosospora]
MLYDRGGDRRPEMIVTEASTRADYGPFTDAARGRIDLARIEVSAILPLLDPVPRKG